MATMKGFVTVRTDSYLANPLTLELAGTLRSRLSQLQFPEAHRRILR
jgi:hypothetical protein